MCSKRAFKMYHGRNALFLHCKIIRLQIADIVHTICVYFWPDLTEPHPPARNIPSPSTQFHPPALQGEDE